MSMVPRCVQCDAKLDPYGRDGGMPLCCKCKSERALERDLRFTMELQAKAKAA